MYYPKLTFASSTIEGIFLFGILCLSNKIYGLDPKISLEVSKSCIWKKPKFASEQHPYWVLCVPDGIKKIFHNASYEKIA